MGRDEPGAVGGDGMWCWRDICFSLKSVSSLDMSRMSYASFLAYKWIPNNGPCSFHLTLSIWHSYIKDTKIEITTLSYFFSFDTFLKLTLKI